MKNCRICGKKIDAFMSFGKMPIANGFLTPDQFHNEYFFDLAPAFCEACGMFQLIDQPDPGRMFHGNYAFFSQTSRRMETHFKTFAHWVMTEIITDDQPFVVEIGSNDGIMLKHFSADGIRHLGVEPSANVARAASTQGIHTICEFFNRNTAGNIRDKYGAADVVLAANVMCHIPDFHSVAAGIVHLLKPDGVLIFEDPYLGDVIEKTSYDQIYDEHVFLFSLRSVMTAFAEHGLAVISILPQETHGGSMRYVLGRKGRHAVQDAVNAQMEKERALGLDRPETYQLFRRHCEVSRDRLTALLEGVKKQDLRVAGYGATSKSTTVTNYCGISVDLVDFISDTTPTKQGKFSPGTHIPVRPYDVFKENYPDIALLFAWNHAGEIMAKETAFNASGGRWLHYVPKVVLR